MRKILVITSEKNQLIKDVIKLKNKKERDKTGLFFIEGERFTDELLNNKNLNIDCLEIIDKVFMSNHYYDNIYLKYNTNLSKLNSLNPNKFILVNDSIFNKISDTVNPQGILTVCKKLDSAIDDYYLSNKDNLFIVLDRITDPGNLGTIIRTSEALGVGAIFLSKNCVDLYNSKVLRATMGAIFHINIFLECNIDDLLTNFKNNNINIVCADLKGTKNPAEVDFTTNTAILIGNEANGVLEKYSKQSNFLVKIPMFGYVESLNASISSSILIYEALRQRAL
ncbi:MAG: RNA methyltransferase [bacterium]